MRAVSYGPTATPYLFPRIQREMSWNFTNLVPATVRLPGLSGGFDNFGSGAAPSEIGNVRVSFTIAQFTPALMEDQLDAINQMAGWGSQKLIVQPSDPADPQRWCYAKVNAINMSRDLTKSGIVQLVTINYQASYPRWYSLGTEAREWGSGIVWGSFTWGGTATANACSGTQTDFTITPGGNAVTRPRIIIACGASQTAQNIKVQRLVGGSVVDEVAYTGTLGNNDTLQINARSWSVQLNGADAYTSAFSFVHPDWMRLQPSAANSIRVIMANSGDACTVKLVNYDMWY